MIWLPICLVAAFIQSMRNGLQKSLATKTLPFELVTWNRFLFGFPVVLLYVIGLLAVGYDLPQTNIDFWLYCSVASVTQIIGNVLLVLLFSRRNFVIGITYSKIEAIMAALLSACLFGELVSVMGFLAVVIGFTGIMTISVIEGNVNPLKLLLGVFNKTALIGVACGAFNAFTGVVIRQASIGLGGDDVLMNASFTLLTMLFIQSLLIGIWVFIKYDNVIPRVKEYAKFGMLIGLTNGIASIGWFTAFTLTQAPYVMAAGQSEIIFSFIITRRVFKEEISKVEILGMALVVVSIFLLIFSN